MFVNRARWRDQKQAVEVLHGRVGRGKFCNDQAGKSILQTATHEQLPMCECAHTHTSFFIFAMYSCMRGASAYDKCAAPVSLFAENRETVLKRPGVHGQKDAKQQIQDEKYDILQTARAKPASARGTTGFCYLSNRKLGWRMSHSLRHT